MLMLHTHLTPNSMCRLQVYIGGDDFKSGQTKMKSVLVDFLVSAGIKPTSIVSYNHLGNNDGKNLSAPQTFRSKVRRARPTNSENLLTRHSWCPLLPSLSQTCADRDIVCLVGWQEISKSNVVDDMVMSNRILYAENEHPDHVVVIKYVPYVGDSKRAMDEYMSEIFMGGTNTIVMHNTCEDSLLATPLIYDLVILTEMAERMAVKKEGEKDFESFHSVRHTHRALAVQKQTRDPFTHPVPHLSTHTVFDTLLVLRCCSVFRC